MRYSALELAKKVYNDKYEYLTGLSLAAEGLLLIPVCYFFHKATNVMDKGDFFAEFLRTSEGKYFMCSITALVGARAWTNFFSRKATLEEAARTFDLTKKEDKKQKDSDALIYKINP